MVTGLRGGQYDAEFRGRTPQERDQLVAAMKDKVAVMEGPWITNILLTFNSENKPFDDMRVRQALTLAIDRWGGSAASASISLIKGVGGVFRPGASFSLSKAELEKEPGFWPDIEKSRAEARRLLKEAGVTNLKLKLVNRTVDRLLLRRHLRRRPMAAHRRRGRGGRAGDQALVRGHGRRQLRRGGANISDFADDPTAQFNTLLSKPSRRSPTRATATPARRHVQPPVAIVDPVERLKLVNELERYVLETAYNFPLLWYQRIVVNHKKVKGWELTPSHLTGQTLVDVWLDE